MKEIPAFAYLYNYYLIPEEYASPEDFLADAARRPTLTLTHLPENDCIAPYFIEEETVLTTVRLAAPDRIHLITAYLCSRDEYTDRLRELVCARCPGCLHYTPPRAGEQVDVSGHTREMSLDGLCLLRAEVEKTYTLIDAADDFWHDLLEAEDSIRKPLFDREYTEAADAMGVIFARYFRSAPETIFSVNRTLGRRYLMFGALTPEARLVVRYLILRAPVEVTEYWTLIDHLPEGISRYVPQGGYDLSETPPTVEFVRLPGKVARYTLSVYCPPAAGGVLAVREAYRYLCAAFGEDLLLTYAAELHIRIDEDYARHRPLRDWAAEVRPFCGFFARGRIGRGFARPSELFLPEIESGSRAPAMRMLAVAPGLALELCGRELAGRMRKVVDEWDIPLCSLELTLPGEDMQTRSLLSGRVTGELIGDLQKDALIMTVSIANTAEKLYIDFFATAAGETVEALRDLTPEFAGMQAKLTVRARSGTRVMWLNYTMDTIKYVPAKREEVTVS